MADDTKRSRRVEARAWLRVQGRLGRRAAMPVVVLGLVATVLAIGQAYCASGALYSALTGQVAIGLFVGFAVLAVGRAGLSVLMERGAFRAGASARRRLRSDALARVLHAGPAQLRASHSGTLTATVIDAIESLDGLFARWTPAATLALAGPAAVGLAVLAVDPIAGLVLFACGLLVPVAMALAGLGAAAASRSQFVAMARLQARFLDRVRGIATIVMHGREATEAEALAKAADELRRRTMRVLRVAFLSSVALDLAAAAAIVMLAVRYGLAWRAGTLAQPGLALFALLLVPEFFAPLRTFSGAYQDRMLAAGAAESLLALPVLPDTPSKAPPGTVRTVAARGVSVAFEDVRLTWDQARGPALDGLSFRAPAGETLVLAGPSGAGKSTVIEILLGFVRPDSGRVTVNGADIADLVPQALSRLTAWIGQRPVLFAASVRDNIRFARPEASDAEIEEAVRAARADRFVASLPNGLDTIIGESGYGVSGGQAQRIAIARAFLKDAPLLLLDEPTAHLDPTTEAEVFESLRRLAIGRTVILASHAAAAHAFGGRRLDIAAGRATATRGAA